MIKQDLLTSSGLLFSTEFIRVVHGKRGDYIELRLDQITAPLINKFPKKSDEELLEEGHYYEWLTVLGFPEIKVYRQLRTVKYADYKPGLYYVSPEYFINFKDPEKLF